MPPLRLQEAWDIAFPGFAHLLGRLNIYKIQRVDLIFILIEMFSYQADFSQRSDSYF